MIEPSPSLARTSGPSGWISDLRTALAFLTRLPLAQSGEPLPDDLARAMRCFPLAGAVVGLAGGLVFLVASFALTPLVAGLLAVGAMAFLTGGLHEDGLADTADGIGGGRDREDALRIMRDSRIGSYGTLALILSVGMRAGAIAGLADAAFGAIIAAAAVSRGLLPAAIALSTPARPDGLGAAAGRPRETDVLTALAIAAVLAALSVGFGATMAVFLLAAGGAATVAWIAKRRIGGYTGDVLGAAQQAAEIAALFAVLAVL